MKKLLLAAFCIIAFSVASVAQKTYDLKFKPKQGEQYDVITNAKSSIRQSMMGKEMVIDMNYDVNMLYDIIKSAENTSLNMTYKTLVIDMTMMGQSMKMSTEDTDNSNPAGTSFKALKNATLSMTVTPKGEVLDVQGADELADRLANVSPAEKEALKAFSNKENIKSTMEQAFKFYPDKPVKIGDTWAGTVTVESPYKLVLNNTYKLVKVENGLAHIDVSGVVTTGGPQKMTSNGMEMMIDLSGDQKGTMTLNEKTGMMQSSNVSQQLKGKMEVMGQEVPMEVKTGSDMKIVKK